MTVQSAIQAIQHLEELADQHQDLPSFSGKAQILLEDTSRRWTGQELIDLLGPSLLVKYIS